MKLGEFTAAITADAVITHSNEESVYLRNNLPQAKVHVVPWSVRTATVNIPFEQRAGIAFIGNFGHAPNLDAARWLIHDIMPLVRLEMPNLECFLVGSDLPDDLRKACRDGVVPLGYVENLSDIFCRVRLTIAPLTFGAGIKGKVIESLAAGVPCVCTEVAAEGLNLPASFAPVIGSTANELKAAAVRLHSDRSFNEAIGMGGRQYVSRYFSESSVDIAMRKMLIKRG